MVWLKLCSFQAHPRMQYVSLMFQRVKVMRGENRECAIKDFLCFTPRLVEDTSCVRATMTCTTRSTLTRSTRRRRGEFHGRAGSTKGRSYNARIAGGSSTSGLCHELPIVDSMTWVPSNVVSMFIKYSSTLLKGKKKLRHPGVNGLRRQGLDGPLW